MYLFILVSKPQNYGLQRHYEEVAWDLEKGEYYYKVE